MLRAVTHSGKLIHECSIPGEGRSRGRFPGHVNAVQADRDRFFVLYTTRSWRGSDDNISVICQIRRDSYDGPVLREVRLAESIDDWDAFGDGRLYTRAHLHPLVFGVPRGAVVDGRTPPNAGLFVFLWHREIREIDPQTGFMLHYKKSVQKLLDVSVTQWTQVRMNAAGDDLDVVQPLATLRQKGYEELYPFCERETRRMVLTMMPPVPMDPAGSEWIGTTAFEPISRESRVATLRFTYNGALDRYEWTRTGPLSVTGLFEPSLVAGPEGSWILAGRLKASAGDPSGGPVGWIRLDEPFDAIGEPVLPEQPRTSAPVTVFRCADGVVRLLTNEPNLSPYNHERNPLYLWDVDVERGFRASEPVVVFDAVERGIPIRDVSLPVIDQAKVLPHTGGSRQVVAHRIRPKSLYEPFKTGVVINEAEQDVSGIYYGALEYDRECEPAWRFG